MKRKGILVLLLVLAVGFAAVSTTLLINGAVTLNIKDDEFKDGVVFDEASLSYDEGTTASISDSGKTLIFETQEMKSVDETATINFKIKNYTQYDAVLGTPAIVCYFVDSHAVDTKATSTGTTNDYVSIVPGTEIDGATILAGGGLSDQSHVTVSLDKGYTGEGDLTIKFQCTIDAHGEESTTPAIKRPKKLFTIDTAGKTVTTLAAGDEISYNDEHFHVLSVAADKVVALADKNLALPDLTAQTTGDNSEGMAFQASDYWNADRPASGTVDLNDITADDEANATVINAARNYGASIGVTGRIITLAEVQALGGSIMGSATTLPEWARGAYWTSTGNNNGKLVAIHKTAAINYWVATTTSFGVRPVLEIPVEKFES